MPAELHLTNQEAELLRQKSANPSAAWQQILRGRAEALARGGLTAVAPYGGDNSISPASEFRGLLTLAPKAARHFQSVTKTRPLRPQRRSGQRGGRILGNDQGARSHHVTTRSFRGAERPPTPGSWSTVFTIRRTRISWPLDLFQLWPVDGGTLVWQVGFASAPFRSYLGGVDRYVAGKANDAGDDRYHQSISSRRRETTLSGAQ